MYLQISPHFLPLHRAIEEENCASHAILQRDLSVDCTKVVDIIYSFKELYRVIPKSYMLQWVGRTRSPGEMGVGYESFLIRRIPKPELKRPDGIFVTAYDKNMTQRECLGEWFTPSKSWNKTIENELIKKVIHLARTTSRLTGGRSLDIPVNNYTITYLFKDPDHKFIRGWHGLRYNAFYLPDVFLENTFNNGRWIKPSDKVWPIGKYFNINETLDKLTDKAGIYPSNKSNNVNYTLYSTSVIHRKI